MGACLALGSLASCVSIQLAVIVLLLVYVDLRILLLARFS